MIPFLGRVFTFTGAVHFLAFSIFFGAAVLRLAAVKWDHKPGDPRSDVVRRLDAVYFYMGGIGIMILFATGMLNVFANIFMGAQVDDRYLVTLGWKLAAALLVILFFIGDLMMTRREKHSKHMLVTQAALFIITGVLGFMLLKFRPDMEALMRDHVIR